jgi:hypothetical protein
MIWLLKNWRIIGGILLAAGTFAAGWVNGSDSVRREWEVDIHIRTKQHMAELVNSQKIITTLEEQKNANLKEVDRLRANNRALWLRLPKTPCPGGLPETATSNTGVASGGELPAEVQSGAEQALNRFDSAYSDEAYRADRIVEECRVVVNWAKSAFSR